MQPLNFLNPQKQVAPVSQHLLLPAALGACQGLPQDHVHSLAVDGLSVACTFAVAAEFAKRRSSRRCRVLQRAVGTATNVVVIEAEDLSEVKPDSYDRCACPICQRPFSKITAAGAVCHPCGLGFPRQSASGFLDLTIEAAVVSEELEKRTSKVDPKPVAEEEGLLARLPFIRETDAIAAQLGLPQSQDLEALGRELLREPQRLLSGDLKPAGTATFQNPLVSFAYERGWRRSFASSGFPGPDEEFRLAQEFFQQADGLAGDVLLDASCGSGLFSRKFLASGNYRTVIALDFSESMLRQVDNFSTKEFGAGYATDLPGKSTLKLVRADIARLPFPSTSLSGVHAGAAIHCWPNPDNAIAEIARVLRPGGIFVLSTFRPRGPLAAFGQGRNPYRFWTEEELRTLTRKCGLTNFKAITKEPAFVMACVQKPKA